MKIIFDIDGTLANIGHRLHLIKPMKGMILTDPGPSDWPAGTEVKVVDIVDRTKSWKETQVSIRPTDIGITARAITRKMRMFDWGPDWEAFHDAAVYDIPIKPMVDLAREFILMGHWVWFVTGRPSSHRDLTLDWLSRELYIPIKDLRLLMRPGGNKNSDVAVKTAIADCLVETGMIPDLVFDDRQRVVDMWRDRGLICAQVAKGDY